MPADDAALGGAMDDTAPTPASMVASLQAALDRIRAVMDKELQQLQERWVENKLLQAQAVDDIATCCGPPPQEIGDTAPPEVTPPQLHLPGSPVHAEDMQAEECPTTRCAKLRGMAISVKAPELDLPYDGLVPEESNETAEPKMILSRQRARSIESGGSIFYKVQLRKVWLAEGHGRMRGKTLALFTRAATEPLERKFSGIESRKRFAQVVQDMTKHFHIVKESQFSHMLRRWNRLLLLHPQSRKRLIWDLIGVLAVTYDLIMTPLQFFNMQETWQIAMIGWIINAFWSLDILLSFRTGVYVDGKLSMKSRVIATTYASSWLLFDVLVLLPEWLALLGDDPVMSDTASVLRVAKLSRLMRLLRLVKVRRLIIALQMWINSNRLLHTLRITLFIIGLLATAHILAGLWFWLGDSGKGWPFAADLQSRSLAYQYFVSLHWSITSFHGSMPVTAITLPEHIFSVLVLPVALVLVSLLVSTITTDLQQMRDFHKDIIAQKMVLCSFLERHKVSPMTSAKLKLFLERAAVVRQERDDDRRLLALLPDHLQRDLVSEIRLPTILGHPLMLFINKVVSPFMKDLAFSMQQDHRLIGESIFETEQECSCMRFVMRGGFFYQREVLRESTEGTWSPALMSPVSYMSRCPSGDRLGPGNYICEPALWILWSTHGSLECTDDGSFLILEAARLEELIRDSEVLFATFCSYARWFAGYIEGLMDVTDVVAHPQTWRDQISCNF